MSPEERERKRQAMIAYNLRKKAGLTKSQEQAERESMEILRINQANEARRAREEAAREKRRQKKEKTERNAAQVDLGALNAIHGTRFRYGQQVIVRGHRYTVIGAKWGAWLYLRGKKDRRVCRPYDAYPVINLSGVVAFDDWTMGPSGKLKIKKG
jgi:Asp-tRNA(Asn)/Glu-tRNA(Gln) amidotransferase A subunit family amidase